MKGQPSCPQLIASISLIYMYLEVKMEVQGLCINISEIFVSSIVSRAAIDKTTFLRVKNLLEKGLKLLFVCFCFNITIPTFNLRAMFLCSKIIRLI